MVSKNRKVIVFEYKRTSPYPAPVEKVEVGVGIFHQWGVNFEEFDNGPGNYSTAIVEMEDGSVMNVEAELVQFINIPKQFDI